MLRCCLPDPPLPNHRLAVLLGAAAAYHPRCPPFPGSLTQCCPLPSPCKTLKSSATTSTYRCRQEITLMSAR
uniref:Uncharacterized protein n=1 Tax=Oryza sativa subsp. japonica TaxID=39947 RepID=Q84PQ2_ORYSJ|nr:hypothetical protein [Oryza sativa Japonica Group]